MISPDLIQALSGISLTGGCLLAIWAFSTDRIVTGKTLDRRDAAWQKRTDELAADCKARIDKLEGKLDVATATLYRQVDEQRQVIAVLEAIGKREGAKP